MAPIRRKSASGTAGKAATLLKAGAKAVAKTKAAGGRKSPASKTKLSKAKRGVKKPVPAAKRVRKAASTDTLAANMSAVAGDLGRLAKTVLRVGGKTFAAELDGLARAATSKVRSVKLPTAKLSTKVRKTKAAAGSLIARIRGRAPSSS